MTSLFSTTFETGTVGSALANGSSGFTTAIGAVQKPSYVTGLKGSVAMRALSGATADFPSMEYVFPALRSTVAVRAYVTMSTAVQFFGIQLQTDAALRAILRINANGSIRMRSGSAAIGAADVGSGAINSSTMTRVEWLITATTQQCRLFTGANVEGSTPDFDTGSISWTPTGTFDRVAVGIVSTTANVSIVYDDFAVDDTTWVGPSSAPPSTISLTPESSTLSAAAVTPAPVGLVSLTPKVANLTPVAVNPQQTSNVTLTPASVTLSAQSAGVQATTSVSDDFNSLTAGNVLGSPWITHPLATGTFTAQTGGKIRETNTTTSLWTHPLIADFADGEIESDVTFVSGSGFTAGPVGRVNASALTFYGARMNNSGALELVKSVAGTVTSLGQYVVNLAAGATIRIGLRMTGTTIVVTGNSVDRITVTDSSVTAAGRVGLRATGGSTTTTGLHIENFEANAAAQSSMPTTEISGYVIDTFCDFSEGDVAEGGFVNQVIGGDGGKLNPSSPGGALYGSKFKTKSVGAVPNETNSDYDASKTNSVVNGVFRTRMHYDPVDGRAKASAIKPLLSGSNPNGENYIAYPRIRVRFRKTYIQPSGTDARGWGSIGIEMIGNSTDWAAGTGEWGLCEGNHVDSRLGVWVRDADHLPNPNRSGHPTFIACEDIPGAPTAINDWHIGEIRSEPGRMRVFLDGVTIYDETTNVPRSDDLYGLLMQSGKPGTPSAGTEAIMEWDWYVVSRYVGAGVTLTPETVSVTPVVVSPVPQSITVNLTPVSVTLTTIAVSSAPSLITINLTPKTVTTTTVATAPTPGLVTVNLTPAVVTSSPVVIVPAPVGLVALSPAAVNVTARPVTAASNLALSLVPASVSLFVPVNAAPDVYSDAYLVGAYPAAIGLVNLTPAVVTVGTVAAPPQPVGIVALAPQVVAVAPMAPALTPGLVTTTLAPAVIPAQSVALAPTPQPVTITHGRPVATLVTVPVSPVAGLIAISLIPVSLTLSVLPVDPRVPLGIVDLGIADFDVVAVPVSPTVTSSAALTPKTVTVSAIPVSPVGQPGTINLGPESVFVVSVPVAPVGQPGVTTLAPESVAVTPVAVAPVPSIITVALTPAVYTTSARPVSPVSTGFLAAVPKVVTVAPVAVSPTPQSVTVSLNPATVVISAQVVGAQSRVDLAPAVVIVAPTATAQAVGQVTTSLTNVGAVVSPVSVAPVPGEISLVTGPTTATVTPVAVAPVAQAVQLALIPVLVYASPWAVGFVEPGHVDLTPGVVVATSSPVASVPGVVSLTLGAATVTVTAVPGGAEAQLITITINAVTATLSALPTDPQTQAVQLTLATATATLAARPLSLVPQLVTTSLSAVTVGLVSVPLLPGAPVGPIVPRLLVAVLRDRSRYAAYMGDLL